MVQVGGGDFAARRFGMSKIKLGMILGTLLGLTDGLLTFLDPAAVEMGMMTAIIVGSTIKGFVTGAIIGWLSARYRSYAVGIIGGLVVGLFLSFLVALMPDPEGGHHYFEIMLPGGIVGVVAGFVCQRWGKVAAAPASGAG